MNEIIAVAGNSNCVDCGEKNPDWASINLGVLMCLTCSGSHRHLGVHISQVRSLKLDTQCWDKDSPLLPFMKSIGNHSFNRSWEKNCPGWVIRPEEYPYEMAVRENFINQKYLWRRFLRKEVGGEPAVTTLANQEEIGWDLKVINEGTVLKNSPSNIISPWQSRHLRFKPSPLGPYLHYYKTATTATAQGKIDLTGATAELVVGGSDKDHQHAFHINTSSDGEHQGRVFSFAVESAMLAVQWVEAVRKYAKQQTKKKGQVLPPQISQLEMSRLNLKRNALEIISREGAAKLRKEILMRSGYTFGAWFARHVVLTDSALFVFEGNESELGKCCCVLELQGAHVETSPAVYSGEQSNGRGVFGVLTAMSHVCFDAGSEDEKIDFVGAINAYIANFPSIINTV